MYSTIDDLYLWSQALFENKLISRRAKEIMFTAHNPAWKRPYGYGWDIMTRRIQGEEKRIVFHDGGRIAKIYRVLGDNHLIVMLTNIRGIDKTDEICEEILRVLFEIP